MMFTTCTICDVKIGAFVKEVWPFILALIAVLIVVTYFPAIIMFLPNLI
jgi:TRAP-type C4-dicarboxylate transport system permease large subunit